MLWLPVVVDVDASCLRACGACLKNSGMLALARTAPCQASGRGRTRTRTHIYVHPIDVHMVWPAPQVAGAADHAALLTPRGEMYTWGQGAGGKLGLGHDQNAAVPQRVHTLWGKVVQQIACGGECDVTSCGNISLGPIRLDAAL